MTVMRFMVHFADTDLPPIPLAATIALPAPTPRDMRVRARRSQMPAPPALIAPALRELRRNSHDCTAFGRPMGCFVWVVTLHAARGAGLPQLKW